MHPLPVALQAFALVISTATAVTGIATGDPALPTRGLPGQAGVPPLIRAADDRGRPAPSRGFVWPLDPVPAVVREFEAPPQPWAAGHRGVDLSAEAGQQVRAAGAGVVSYSGTIVGRGVVAVTHANGWKTTYEPVDQRVPTGTHVAAGDPIGVIATAPAHCAPRACLHWGLLIAADVYRDPLTLVKIGRPILLPLG
ncbi:M23 family metallopeptidase [Rudaeicoccus suwonensis]|uniref:Peptidase M23-like protein n=1 Tax=Rudaeicoccus suwonensis TaxID=657409 RepID=A0A561EBY6_9MICO|nr:M23 family metallopeptidase [Rudaeicoccus suwonensis]TWE13121.1 peptidase M23-like protein [Rudaeicoccus suwonensis]